MSIVTDDWVHRVVMATRSFEAAHPSDYVRVRKELEDFAAMLASNDLHQHLLDLLGAKDHEDAARIIAQHHATASDVIGLSHELWAAAQLAPGEGIEDGASRIEEIIAEQLPSKNGGQSVQDALRWCAGGLQSVCQSGRRLHEGDLIKLGDETCSLGQILDRADAALAAKEKDDE